ncbi:MAG TPA: heme biosynthesis HemY N-terminal domain-containing protein, partial [Beijerinckiaceae bacterium]
MIRVLVFLAVLAALAFGFSWIADQPGQVSVVFGGQAYEMRLVVALGALLLAIVATMILWSVARFVLRIPTLMSVTARMRRRNKGFSALTKGMLAAGAGDAPAAARAARDAEKLMGDEPLALLLAAQSAQLSGDRARAERVFQRMAERPDTQAIGLRGLHVEARRRGDDVAAHEYARRAHELAALPWAGQAMLEKHAMADDWQGALAVVEANLARKTIDRAAANRQRAVLKTAIGQKLQDRDPTEALALAREALKLAPDLTPAAVLAGRLLSRKGDLRRAAKLLEASWRRQPHPDVARAYLDVRPGDSAADRLARARTLARLAPDHPESRLAVARAALEARDFALARRTMAELVESERRPTVRACLVMADIEETEHGPSGRMREWLSRAARAPRDPAWVADGVVSEEWLPASPINGRLDAFRWETPLERIAAQGPEDAPPPVLIPPEPVGAFDDEPVAT